MQRAALVVVAYNLHTILVSPRTGQVNTRVRPEAAVTSVHIREANLVLWKRHACALKATRVCSTLEAKRLRIGVNTW